MILIKFNPEIIWICFGDRHLVQKDKQRTMKTSLWTVNPRVFVYGISLLNVSTKHFSKYIKNIFALAFHLFFLFYNLKNFSPIILETRFLGTCSLGTSHCPSSLNAWGMGGLSDGEEGGCLGELLDFSSFPICAHPCWLQEPLFLAGAEASLGLHSVPYSHGNTSKLPTNKDGSTSSKNKEKKKDTNS